VSDDPQPEQGPEDAGPTDAASRPVGDAGEGFEPLQDAARQLIAAARAFLDAAEALVDDPEAVGQVVSVVSETARDAARVAAAAGRRAARAASGGSATGGGTAGAGGDDDDGEGGSLQSIPVE
jgi:hypothetical protein